MVSTGKPRLTHKVLIEPIAEASEGLYRTMFLGPQNLLVLAFTELGRHFGPEKRYLAPQNSGNFRSATFLT